MDDDWDLQAVVRSCGAATTSSSTTPSPPLPSPITTLPTTSSNALNLQSFCSSNFQPQLVEENNLICFQDLFEPRQDKDVVIKELHDLCKPFFFQTSKLSQPISPQSAASPLSVLGCFQDLSSQQHQQTSSFFSIKKSDGSNTHNPRPKKRKNQMKKVCQIPIEGVSSDMWSWRKYGQKPIKGSPYPRGYYKCSTSKGCLARKQVERDRSYPTMLIVTYTGEHNHPMLTHRKSLAGRTHQNTAITTDYGAAAEKLESSAEDKETDEEEEEDDFDISNMPLDDEFFAGLDNELVRPSPERLFSGNNSISLVVE